MAAALTQHEDSLNYGQNWDLLSDHAVGLDGALAREDAGKGRECAETAVPMQFGQASITGRAGMPQQLTGKVEFLNDDGQTVVTIDPINSPQLKITPPSADIAEVRNGELAADRVSVHIISVDRISVDNVIVGSTDHPGVFEIRNSDFPGVRFSDLTHRTQCSISVGRATKATYASETTPIASGYTSMQGKARYS